jgi:hypothetical protein
MGGRQKRDRLSLAFSSADIFVLVAQDTTVVIRPLILRYHWLPPKSPPLSLQNRGDEDEAPSGLTLDQFELLRLRLSQ